MIFRLLAAAALLAGSAPLAAAAPVVLHDSTAYHLLPPGQHKLHPATSPKMKYYGGPVLASSQVVTVFWGAGVNKTTIKSIGGFLGSIVNSTFVDQLAQYSTNIVAVDGQQGTDQTITRGTYLGQFTITPSNTAKTLTDAAIQTELLAQIAAGHLPAATLNTLYMIYFPPTITITMGSAKSCVAFEAYHSAVSATVTPSNVFYGVMPDCGSGFSALTVASSHEFAEATTDAIPTPGSHPAYPQAWNTTGGYEIGDVCEGTNTTLVTAGKTYSIQEVFDNATNACATGKFHSP